MPKILLVILFAFVMPFTGCTCADRYDPFLAQVQENLEKLRPKFAAGNALRVGQEPKKKDIFDQDQDEFDATLAAVKRVRQAGPEARAAVDKAGTPKCPEEPACSNVPPGCLRDVHRRDRTHDDHNHLYLHDDGSVCHAFCPITCHEGGR